MNLNKKVVDKDSLLREVSDIDIYRCYAPNIEIELGKRQLSPLRKEDNASFALFANDGEVLFKDFVLGGGDCIRFIQLMFGDSFFEAMSRVVIDFNLQDKFHYKDIQTNYKPPQNEINREEVMKKAGKALLQIRRRKWKIRDAHFWTPFGIDLATLKKYNVVPITHFFVNNQIITCDDQAYAYIEYKDNYETFKIYQPNRPEFKWLNNHDESVWQGWEQLPEKGDDLIITKSLKDVMTITNLTGIPAISLQAESVHPKEHIMKELKKRFDRIWVWYDNDYDSETNWGREYGAGLAQAFNLIQIEIPDSEEIKDPSDYCAIKGEEETKKLIKKLTELPF